MRDIKFRAWDKSNNKIVYEGFDIDPTGNIWINQFSVREQFELMQYTGLKDKNGKEIWEGDILTGGHLEYKNHQIEYSYHCFWPKGWGTGDVEMQCCPPAFELCEVIGNIYENPELLK